MPPENQQEAIRRQVSLEIDNFVVEACLDWDCDPPFRVEITWDE
jgi:hypothetical protein